MANVSCGEQRSVDARDDVVSECGGAVSDAEELGRSIVGGEHGDVDALIEGLRRGHEGQVFGGATGDRVLVDIRSDEGGATDVVLAVDRVCQREGDDPAADRRHCDNVAGCVEEVEGKRGWKTELWWQSQGEEVATDRAVRNTPVGFEVDGAEHRRARRGHLDVGDCIGDLCGAGRR